MLQYFYLTFRLHLRFKYLFFDTSRQLHGSRKLLSKSILPRRTVFSVPRIYLHSEFHAPQILFSTSAVSSHTILVILITNPPSFLDISDHVLLSMVIIPMNFSLSAKRNWRIHCPDGVSAPLHHVPSPCLAPTLPRGLPGVAPRQATRSAALFFARE